VWKRPSGEKTGGEKPRGKDLAPIEIQYIDDAENNQMKVKMV